MKRKIKKAILVLISVILLIDMIGTETGILLAEEISDVWYGEIASSFSEGDGSEENPYLISSAEELALLAKVVNEGNSNYNAKNYRMTQSINLNVHYRWKYWGEAETDLNQWTPIGNEKNKFKGTFDGNNCTIYGMYISGNNSNVGLFGAIENAILSNIKIQSFNVNGANNVGGVVGYSSYSDISNCVAWGYVDASGSYCGGIAGYYSSGEKKVTVKESVSYSEIKGVNKVGGIVGYIDAKANTMDVSVENCINNGAVSVSGNDCGGVVGGITSDSRQVTFLYCTNKGKIESLGKKTGGIIGNAGTDDGCSYGYNIYVNGCRNLAIVAGKYSTGGLVGYTYPAWSSQVYISASYNSGDVFGTSNIGGILGTSYATVGGTTKICNCYNDAQVYGEDFVGGIHGYYGKRGSYGSSGKYVYYCYNIGDIISDGQKGAIAGYIGPDSYYSKCYYLDTCIGDATNSTGEKLTNVEMKDKYSFSGFDFNDIWKMTSGVNKDYPYLAATIQDYDSVITNEAGGYINWGDKDCQKEFDIYVAGLPKLSEEDARTFIAFIYNEKKYEEIDVTQEDIYKLLTGELSEYQGNLSNLRADLEALSIFVRANINHNVGQSSNNVAYLTDELIKYLQTELAGMEEMDVGIVNKYEDKALKYLEDGLESFFASIVAEHTGICIKKEIFETSSLVIEKYNDILNIGSKIETYVNRVVAGIQAAALPIENEKEGRYEYFASYLNNRSQYQDSSDEIFQIVMESNFFAIKDNTYISAAIDLTTWITGKDSWINHRETIDRWAEYLYDMEQYINTDVHNYEKVVVENTCERNGYTEYECSYCGRAYISDLVKAKGHDFEFSESRNYIYVTCKNDTSHFAYAFINAENVVYNGTEQKMAVIYYDNNWERLGLNKNMSIIYTGDVVNPGIVQARGVYDYGNTQYAVSCSYEILEGGSCGDNVTFTLDNEGTLVISGTGYINGKTFKNSDTIEKIVINEGVEGIEAYAFFNCKSLKEISIQKV